MKGKYGVAGCYLIIRTFCRLVRRIIKLLIKVILLIPKSIIFIINKIRDTRFQKFIEPRKIKPEVTEPNTKTANIKEDECPEFREIFEAGDGIIIGVEYITRTPDETAVIRVLSDKSFSKQFKKKVYTEKNASKSKYIKVDGKKLYIKNTRVYLD